MFFIKHKNENKLMPTASALQAIASRWVRCKKRIAAFLQVRFEQLSSRKKNVCLLIFCLLFGGSSALLVVNALNSKTKRAGTISIAESVKPQVFLKRSGSDSTITKKEYDRIERYKTDILELNKTKEGQTLLDSLLSERPELMDSIALLENIYLSQ
ncbi:MAG TPA: hypothetical protein VFW07_15565 [Parafilimonas sp.]|nr:hypothetical protein [Parafilimonas sp.]